jgi:alkanesulfonate monooxygenase SsuD/methylene tetrahydromethanopterin reductase-like flavin-dependent oxidoreductase (luciferase family)
MEVRRDVIVGAAQLADELGYEVVSVPEGWGHDSSLLMAEIAASTKQIQIASGILSIWGRTAGTLAMTAATLYRISKGRFILGLGASTPQLVEGFHGIPFAQPARRLRETTLAVRALLKGEPSPLAVNGSRPIKLGQEPVPNLPIWIAASGEHTMRVAFDLADGWYPIYLSRERCRELTARTSVTVACGPWTVADEDPAAARAAVAACMARYMTAMGEIYPRLVAGQGFAAEVELVRQAPRGTVPDEAGRLMDEFTVAGTPSEVRDQYPQWDELADITLLGLPPGLPWAQIETTLRAAAPL